MNNWFLVTLPDHCDVYCRLRPTPSPPPPRKNRHRNRRFQLWSSEFAAKKVCPVFELIVVVRIQATNRCRFLRSAVFGLRVLNNSAKQKPGLGFWDLSDSILPHKNAKKVCFFYLTTITRDGVWNKEYRIDVLEKKLINTFDFWLSGTTCSAFCSQPISY